MADDIAVDVVQAPGDALVGLWLTFPRFRDLALAADADGPVVAVLARAGDAVAGLALAAVGADGRAELCSCFVERAHRGRGIGTRLFAALEAELPRRGAAGLTLGYLDGDASATAAAAMLARAGWAPAVMDRLVVQGDRGLAVVDWFQRPRRVPAGAEIFPWTELTDADRAGLEAADWYGPMVDPFRLEGPPAFNSVGMRWRGRVVGWVLVEQIDAQTLRYSRSYADPALHRLGIVVALYVHSYNQQLARPEIPFSTWTVPSIYPAMLAFTRRWMVPLALSAREWLVAERSYPPAAASG